MIIIGLRGDVVEVLTVPMVSDEKCQFEHFSEGRPLFQQCKIEICWNCSTGPNLTKIWENHLWDIKVLYSNLYRFFFTVPMVSDEKCQFEHFPEGRPVSWNQKK